MSLLNDALKRAEKARPDANAFSAGPALEPVTLSRRVVPRRSMFLPVLIFCVLLLAGFFIWQWYVGVVEVKARTRIEPAAEEIKPKPQPTEPAPKTNLPAVVETTNTAAPVLPPTNSSIVHSLASALTNWKSAVTPAREPDYKLQGIFFFPKRPSAVINGETVFIGDRISGATVTAIGTNSATISVSGQNQVLELPQ